MSKTKLSSEVVVHAFNGDVEDAPKFVEVDGKKFVDDGSGKAKLGDDGKPVPFEEKKVEAPKIDNVAEADLEALAKVNPLVAKMLSEKSDAEKKLADQIKADDDAKRKTAEKNGEWQKLAEEERQKREKAEADLATKTEQLSKYVGSVESILKDVIATIPKEKLTLIPDGFSPRQKLEYITKNAKLLGAKVAINTTGEKVDGSDGAPAVTDEEKLVKEIEELRKKTPRTASEDKLMFEKASALKALRAKKQS